jgi:beta-glucanase (GH16 family)
LNLTGYKMTFHDEFDSLNLWNGTSGTWRADYGKGALGVANLDAYTLRGNSEKEIYVAPGFKGTAGHDLGLNPFSISNGVLNITASKIPTALQSSTWGYQYASGQINTKQSFSQTYGYFEIRAQMPQGKGFWPAFWLLRQDGKWPPEIDVIEQLGHDPNTYYGTVHSAASGSHTSHTDAIKTSSVSTGFHTYGVNWDKTNIVFYEDGKEVARQATPADMHSPMYMIANLAVGGGWPGNPDGTTQFPSQMKIDYIRAYALPGSSTGGSTATTPAPTPAPAPAPAAGGDINGGAGNDYLLGTTAANKIVGNGGNDWIDGKQGDDTLTGGAGADTFVLNPGHGHDTVTDFGNGDHLYLKNFGGKAPTISQSGADTVVKYATGESMTLKGVQASTLTHKADWSMIDGHAAPASGSTAPSAPATSSPSTVTKAGTAGNDALVGGAGAETFSGLGGDDWLEGKGGNDILTGGAGHDLFAFGAGSGKDTVTDFNTTMDKLFIGGEVKAGHIPTIAQSGADTVITFTASDVVTLKNVDMHTLSHSSDWNYLM